MKKRYFLIAGLAVMAMAGCQEPMQRPEDDRPVFDSPMGETVKGKIRILLSEEMRQVFEAATDEKGMVRLESVKSAENIPQELEVISVERLFREDPRFVKRIHKSGLDKWYEITFNEEIPLTKAADCVSGMDGVEYAEYVYIPKVEAEEVYPFAVNYPFNDRRATEQWHYQNDGSRANSIAGSDINLYAAYEKYGITGNQDVIVAIVDGGLDYDHEDLAQNMWINEAEMNGTTGVDDDGNGFVDDIYGYNFVSLNGNIIEHTHGTHVGGTVAAVNNNGVGVAGVAGGNGSPDSGVRIMSCQIFEETDNPEVDRGGNSAQAIYYGANNGAVISQNSWGYDPTKGSTTTPYSIRAAIDYFINYAGMDDDGNQIGPMAGGVVIFAAGNDNYPDAAPGNYEPTIAVAALNAQYERARYSNYGSWIDVSAPGGEDVSGNYILSTTPGNNYGWLQGTSMACPHVSGIAALIVSAKGGPGFTNKDLEEILLNSCDPVIYEYNKNDLHGNLEEGYQLGRGLVNTAWAVSVVSEIAPERPEFEVAEPESNIMSLTVDVPSDEDDGEASFFQVYYSTSEFSSVDYDNIPSNINAMEYKITDLANATEGDPSSKIINVGGLDFDQKYYVAVSASDRAKNISELSTIKSVTTGPNHAPEINFPEEYRDFILKSYASAEIAVDITDPDGHTVTAEVVCGNGKKLQSELIDGVFMVYVNGWEFLEGEYTAEITAKDEYGMESAASFAFSVRPNSTPSLIAGGIPGLSFNEIGATSGFDAADYITDNDGDSLSFTYKLNNANVVSVNQAGSSFELTSINYGSAVLTVIASDGVGDPFETEVKILVRDATEIVDVYPNPVYNELNIRPGDAGKYKIVVSNTSGGVLFNDTVDASPFAPLTLDMSTRPMGVYNISVTAEDGTVFKTNVVKY